MATPEAVGQSDTGWLTGKLIAAFVLIALIDVLGYYLLGMSDVVPTMERWVDWDKLWTDIKWVSAIISFGWLLTFAIVALLTAYFLSKPKWFRATLTVLGSILLFLAILTKQDVAHSVGDAPRAGGQEWRVVSHYKGTIVEHQIEGNDVYVVIRFPWWTTEFNCVNGVGRWQYRNHPNGGALRCTNNGRTVEINTQNSTDPTQWQKIYLKRGKG